MQARNLREWVWFIAAIGIVLRFQGLDWDRGLMFNPDERNIGYAAAALGFPDRLVPDFSAYNGLSLYLPRLLAEMLAPLTGRPGSDPAGVIFASRLLSAGFASLALAPLWSIARRLWTPQVALFVLVCGAFCPALIQSAHFGTTEAALILCLLVTVALSLNHVLGRLALTPIAVSVGVVLGLGFGFKTTSLIFAILPAVAVIETTLLKGRFVATLAAGALALGIVVVIALTTTPQIWAASVGFFETMQFEGGIVSGAQDVFWTYQFTDAPDGLFELSQLPWLLGPLLPPLGLAGFLAVLFGLARQRPHARPLAALAAFTLVYAVTIGTWYAKFVRYEFLLLPPLLLFAGYLVSQIAGARLRQGVMVAVAGLTAVVGLSQAAIYLAPDPRIAAWDWLSPQLRAGDAIVVEPVDIGSAYWYTSTPITMNVLPLIDPSTPEKRATIASTVANGTWMIVASRRHHAVLPRMPDRFPEMCPYYDALWSGRLGYEVVGRFMRRPVINWALAPEVWAEETFTVFDSPEVLVLRNVSQLSASQIEEEMQSAPIGCADRGTIPTPPR